MDQPKSILHRSILWLTIRFAVIIPLMLAITTLLPSEYAAVSTIAARESELDQSQPRLQNAREEYLRIKYGLLDGLSLIEVITDLGIGQNQLADTSARALADRIRLRTLGLKSGEIDETELADRLVEHIQDRVLVKRVGENKISVGYRGTEDAFNIKLVNAIVEQFIEKSAVSRPATAATDLELLEERLSQHRAGMENSQRKLDEFQKGRLVEVASAIEAAHNELERGRHELEAARNNLRDMSVQLAILEGQVSSSKVATSPQLDQQTKQRINGLIQVVAKMEVQLSQMKAARTDKHPLVVALEGELAEIKNELAAEQNALVTVNTDEPDPEIEKLRTQKTRMIAEKDLERARIDTLSAKVRQDETRLGSLSEDKRLLDKLTREHTLNENLYNNYLKRLASVQLGEDSGQETVAIKRYEIVERAASTAVPVGPNRAILFTVGTLSCVVVCFFATLSAAFIGNSLRTPSGIPISVGVQAQPGAATGTFERRGSVKRAAWYALLTLVYCLTIFALSSMGRPPDVLREIAKHDLMAHVVMYAGLGWLVGMTVRAGAMRLRTWQYWIVPVVFVALYGLTNELHQWLVLGRHSDISDLSEWIADIIGGSAAQLIFPLRTWLHRRTQK